MDVLLNRNSCIVDDVTWDMFAKYLEKYPDLHYDGVYEKPID